jgi:uncharacterized protein with PQ loop repeat
VFVLSPHVYDLSVVNVLGFVSVVLATWFALPQLIKLRADGSTAGLNLESLVNSTISLTGWTVYGVAHANFWVVLASAAGIPATVATVAIAVRAGHRLRPTMPLVWAGLLLLTAVVDWLYGSHLIDLVLGCSILWFVAPAAVTAWRSADVSGLSPQTWLVLAADGAVFGLYGVVAGVTADRVYALTSLTGAAVVLARIARGPLAAGRDGRGVRGAEEATHALADPQVVREADEPAVASGGSVERDADVVAARPVRVVDADGHNRTLDGVAGGQHLVVLS